MRIESCTDSFYGGESVKTLGGNTEAQSLLSSIRRDAVGGENFRRNLSSLAVNMGQEWRKSGQTASVIIAIPRGGTPMGTGLSEVFPQALYFETNDGKNKVESQPLLPHDFPRRYIEHMIIADTVIGTGETIERTLREVERASAIGHVHVFTAVASRPGVESLLARRPLHLRIFAGCIEDQCEWVIKDGKPVLFVSGIGDAGELVSV